MNKNEENIQLYPDFEPETDAVLPSEQETAQTQPLTPDAILSSITVEKRSFPVFSGLVGALLGSIPGVLLWIFLGQVGFIAGISGWLMIRGAMFGYNKLAHGIDRRGEIFSTIVALFMPIVSEYFGISVSVYRNFHESYSISVLDAIKIVPLYLAEPDILQGIIINLLIGYALIGLSFISFKPRQPKQQVGGIPRL